MSFVRPSDESVFGGSIKIREPAEVRARELRRQAAWGFSGRSEGWIAKVICFLCSNALSSGGVR